MDQDPSYFEYYNICHQMAIFFTRFDTSQYDLDNGILVEDISMGLNRLLMPVDDADDFFVVNSLVLEHGFSLDAR